MKNTQTGKVKPITPKEVFIARKEIIPDEIIEATNELIVKNWNRASMSSYFKLSELVPLVLAKMPDMTEQQLYNNRLLDIEDVFADFDWLVKYDSEIPSFSFKVKKKEPKEPSLDYDRDY